MSFCMCNTPELPILASEHLSHHFILSILNQTAHVSWIFSPTVEIDNWEPIICTRSHLTWHLKAIGDKVWFRLTEHRNMVSRYDSIGLWEFMISLRVPVTPIVATDGVCIPYMIRWYMMRRGESTVESPKYILPLAQFISTILAS